MCLPEGEEVPEPDAMPQPMSENTPDAAVPDAAPTTRPCEGGDQAFLESGRCYLAFLTAAAWGAAAAACEAEDAQLVTVGSEEEGARLATHLGEAEWWMGASDAAVEGDWEWHTGEPMDYTNWRAGEPNNGGVAGEDCGILEGHNGGLWDDRACEDGYRFLCERD
jgi:hypothetical protein